jgi:hypothetical protein
MKTRLPNNGTKIVLIILALITISSSASAFWPYQGGYNGWYGGDVYYSNYSQESVPYYALHPPVYYSYPVARTYGLYPFPYYADTPISPSATVEPKLVINSFVEQQTTQSITTEQQPLRILNPFVEQPEDSKSVKKASWERPVSVKTKVIYPLKMTSNQ